MEYGDTSHKPTPPSKPTNKRGWAGVLGKVKHQLEESKARKKAKSPSDRAADRTATATVWIGVFTVVLAVIAYFQYREIMGGGIDTAALVDASRKQARSAQQIAGASRKNAAAAEGFAASAGGINTKLNDAVGKLNDQAEATKALAEQAIIQSNVAKVTAGAAQSAAEISQKAMELSERPWLVVSATIASALTYDKDGGGHITLHYSIVNIGHSPAIGVEIAPEFYVANGKKPDAIVERRRLCKELEMRSSFGETIYPGQVFEQNWSFSAAKSDLDDSLHHFGDDFFVTNIVDCVAYKANFSDQAYSVGSSYGLFKFSSTGQGVSFPPYIDMPLGSLVLAPSGYSSKDAK